MMDGVKKGRLVCYGDLLDSLAAIGAQRDEKGAFMIYGYEANSTPPSLFLGIEARNNEVLVDDSCYCLVNGEQVNLLSVASRSSAGPLCVVIA